MVANTAKPGLHSIEVAGRQFLNTLVDAWDVVRHVRNPWQLVRAIAPGAPRVLNPTAAEGELGPGELAVAMRKLRNRLKAEAVADGKVDYNRVRSGPLREQLERVAGQLHHQDPAMLQGDCARLAFWINLYNVLSIHGVIALDIQKSVMEVPSFFSKVAYRVGAHTFTLDEIETGVLRKNAPHPVSHKPLFQPDDPRCRYSPEHLDPRLHTALVCTAKSCPPIAFFDGDDPQTLDAQLDLAAQNFIAGTTSVDEQKREIKLHLVLHWYAGDFGGRDAVLEFVCKHAEPELAQAVAHAREAGYRVVFDRYDWSLNQLA